jgi:hypothetical protein
MKTLLLLTVISAFVSVAVSDCGDLFHAHCELYWNFENARCTDVLQILAGQFKACCMDKDIEPNYTHYSLSSVDTDTLTVSGTIKFNDGYVDDQTIQLTQNGTDCSGYGCSHSESLSYYDYCANYCDIHNLVRGIGYQFTETTGSCRNYPDNPDVYCNSQ